MPRCIGKCRAEVLGRGLNGPQHQRKDLLRSKIGTDLLYGICSDACCPATALRQPIEAHPWRPMLRNANLNLVAWL
jgi:hypothetical protein